MFKRKNRIEKLDAYVEERLSEYLDGTLSTQERATVEEYLATSKEARESLESLRYTVNLLKQTAAPALPRQFTLPVTSRVPARGAPAWLTWGLRGVAAAATAAFVILLTATLLRQPNNLQMASAPAAQVQPSVVVAFAQTPLATFAPAQASDSAAATSSPLMITVPAPLAANEVSRLTTTPPATNAPQPTAAKAQNQDVFSPSGQHAPTVSASAELAPPTPTSANAVTTASAAGSSAPAANTPVLATATADVLTQSRTTVLEVEGIVTVAQLRVRRGPGLEYPSIGGLKRGDRVIVLGRSLNNGWLAILYPKNQETAIGWIGAAFVKLTAPLDILPIFATPEPAKPELTPTTELPSPTPTATETPTPTGN